MENTLPILTGGVGESSTMIGGEDVREFSTLEVAVALNGLKTSGVSVAIFDDVEVLADNWGPICGIGGGVGSVGMALLTASCKVKLNKTLIKQLKYSKKYRQIPISFFQL